MDVPGVDVMLRVVSYFLYRRRKGKRKELEGEEKVKERKKKESKRKQLKYRTGQVGKTVKDRRKKWDKRDLGKQSDWRGQTRTS